MKNQTAVEWLQEAISKKVNNELGPYFIDLFDNAKAMEREWLEYTYDSSTEYGNFGIDMSGKEFYDKTFKQDNL
jgi:hypothetical protein